MGLAAQLPSALRFSMPLWLWPTLWPQAQPSFLSWRMCRPHIFFFFFCIDEALLLNFHKPCISFSLVRLPEFDWNNRTIQIICINTNDIVEQYKLYTSSCVCVYIYIYNVQIICIMYKLYTYNYIHHCVTSRELDLLTFGSLASALGPVQSWSLRQSPHKWRAWGMDTHVLSFQSGLALPHCMTLVLVLILKASVFLSEK